MTSAPNSRDPSEPSAIKRFGRVLVSVIVLTPLTVFLGYGGWLVLTVTAAIGGYDPRTEDDDLLRERLLVWPDRNRDVMRTNGRAELPLQP